MPDIQYDNSVILEVKHFSGSAIFDSGNELLILFCASGKGEMFCDNLCISLNENDIIIIPPSTTRKICADSIFEIYSLKVGKVFCEKNGIDLSRYIFAKSASDSEVSSLFNIIIEKNSSVYELSHFSVIHTTILLLIYIIRNHSSKISSLIKDKSNSVSVERAERIIQYLKENISQNISIKELADQIHISKYYFLHEFKNVTGFTISQVKNILRCREAKKLLEDSNYSTLDISEKCGFNNYSYFYTVFKKETGLSPIEYRQKHNK